MKKRKLLIPESKLIELLNSNLTLCKIATIAGFSSKASLYPYIKKYDICRKQKFNAPSKNILAELVAQNLKRHEIANKLNCTIHSIRYWTRKYGILKPVPIDNKCKNCNIEITKGKFCSKKCKNRFFARKAMTGKNRRVKKEIVMLFGGKCSNCGYDKNLASLVFHHKGEKSFTLSSNVLCHKSKSEILKELETCIILCSNCHGELHHPELNDWHSKDY